MIVDKQPSRKKIFSEIHVSEDIELWSIDVQGKNIRCAKVLNPVILTKPGSNSWTQLAAVQRLEIEDPEATQSTIPKQIVTELRNLESLSFTWTKIKSLPSALFQLPLNSLYLQRNQIKTVNGIERASLLTILDLSNNCLHCLPKSFGQLKSLVTLNLSGNRLAELPESIGSLSQLKTLDCSCNKLRSLPDSLGNIIELTSLDLSTNHLTSLPESVGFLPKLEDLRLSSNQLTFLPVSFGQLNRLHALLLRNNKFGQVPEQLSQLTSLQSLNLRENMIAHMDQSVKSLKYLILDQNHLTQIDGGILHCTNLQYLSLKSNNIGDVTADIWKLTNVRSLNLSHNPFNELPHELDRLPHLRHLSLCSTKIRWVPLSVASLPTLKTLELDECSELDSYLNIAYKNNGLSGVVDHLTKNKDKHVETARNRPESAVTKQLRDDTDVRTLYPSDCDPGHTSGSERDTAVPETSSASPPSEVIDHLSKNDKVVIPVARNRLESVKQLREDADVTTKYPIDCDPGDASGTGDAAMCGTSSASPPSDVDHIDKNDKVKPVAKNRSESTATKQLRGKTDMTTKYPNDCAPGEASGTEPVSRDAASPPIVSGTSCVPLPSSEVDHKNKNKVKPVAKNRPESTTSKQLRGKTDVTTNYPNDCVPGDASGTEPVSRDTAVSATTSTVPPPSEAGHKNKNKNKAKPVAKNRPVSTVTKLLRGKTDVTTKYPNDSSPGDASGSGDAAVPGTTSTTPPPSEMTSKVEDPGDASSPHPVAAPRRSASTTDKPRPAKPYKPVAQSRRDSTGDPDTKPTSPGVSPQPASRLSTVVEPTSTADTRVVAAPAPQARERKSSSSSTTDQLKQPSELTKAQPAAATSQDPGAGNTSTAAATKPRPPVKKKPPPKTTT